SFDGQRAVRLVQPDRDEEMIHEELREDNKKPKPPPPSVWFCGERGGPAQACEALKQVDECLFAPTSHHLVAVTHRKAGGATLRVHDATRKYAVVATLSLKRELLGHVLSGDGKRLVVVEKGEAEGLVRALSFPGLKAQGSFKVPVSSPQALSHDGKVLALSRGGRSGPYLVRTDTGARIAPASGHTGAITHLFFTLDGKG